MIDRMKFERDVKSEYDMLNNEGKRLVLYLTDPVHNENIQEIIKTGTEFNFRVNLKQLDITLYRSDLLFDNNNISFINQESLVFVKLASSIARKKSVLDCI